MYSQNFSVDSMIKFCATSKMNAAICFWELNERKKLPLKTDLHQRKKLVFFGWVKMAEFLKRQNKYVLREKKCFFTIIC